MELNKTAENMRLRISYIRRPEKGQCPCRYVRRMMEKYAGKHKFGKIYRGYFKIRRQSDYSGVES
jgi:hypothetical protein